MQIQFESVEEVIQTANSSFQGRKELPALFWGD